MDTRVQIVASFHRFVPATDEKGQPIMVTLNRLVRDESDRPVWKEFQEQRERREDFLAGQTGSAPGTWPSGAVVSEADAQDWIEKCLAKPLNGDKTSRRSSTATEPPAPETASA